MNTLRDLRSYYPEDIFCEAYPKEAYSYFCKLGMKLLKQGYPADEIHDTLENKLLTKFNLR